MGTPTQGMGQQNGDATAAGGQIVEVTAWDFEPAEKLGGVVTNVTGGFEGQVYGAISGKGKVTVLVPKTGSCVPFVFGADTVLNLYADKARQHGFQQINAALESARWRSTCLRTRGSRSRSISSPTGRTTPSARSRSWAATTTFTPAAAGIESGERGAGSGE